MNRKTISAILTVISIYMPYLTLELIIVALRDYWELWFYWLLMGTLITGLISLAIEIFIEKPKKKEKEQKMSKYSEALKILKKKNMPNFAYELDILKEAIQKAKQYDELEKRNSETFIANVGVYNQEHINYMYKKQVDELRQENQEHKEHIEYLEGKIKLLEKSIEAFEEENEILKEGLKND